MSKVLKADYDDATPTLDREKVSVSVEHAKPKKPWAHLENSLTGEDAESFGRAIEEAFPIEPVRK
ncbi:MAG TPA: hypothetical protein VGQ65_11395 [Thermoanaerobaculia bacterium]|jgi:hypothetical protein|nr:hypothetical protein [Thermoanaerobaculia bacterium]